jgi:hypothetical protein
VLGVLLVDHVEATFAANNLVIRAALLDAGSNLHESSRIWTLDPTVMLFFFAVPAIEQPSPADFPK